MWPQGWIYGAAIALLDGQSHKMELLNGRVLTQKIADFPILWKYLVRWRGTNLIIWLKCVVWWTNNDSPRILLQVLGLTFFSVCTFFLRMSLVLRTYFHTISVSNNWVVFSALRILSTEIARKFWRIERTIRTCFCIQFIWRISCDPLYLQLFRCWIPSGSHLVHILDKLMNVL